MKTKRLTAILLIIATVIIAFSFLSPKSEYYDRYKKYKYVYFPDYSSLNNSLSEKDRAEAEKILSEAKEVFTFIGESEPQKDVGELKRYYRLSPDITEINLDIEAVAGDFTGNNGYLWVIYSVERLDETGDTSSGSWDILTYWKLKKLDGEWKVIKVKEPA